MKTGRLTGVLALFGTVMALAGASGAQTTLDDILRPTAKGDVRSFVRAAKEAGTFLTTAEDTRIYGGRPAEPDAWPWQVSLHTAKDVGSDQRSRVLSQFCGGSLIARQWVLTAAHCIEDFEGNVIAPSEILIRSGNVALWEGDFREVVAVFSHPDYDPVRIDNDIAILKLAQPISESSGPVGAIPVLQDGSQLQPGPAVSVGWGLMEENTVPGVLMEVEIDIVSNDNCNRGFAEQTRRDIGSFLLTMGVAHEIPEDKLIQAFELISPNIGNALTDNMICAGVPSGNKDSCNGDSGGPLMVRRDDGGWMQVGIVSWGKMPLGAQTACGLPSLYGVYTRASNYFDWIATTIRSN